jgi:hypothetical protein
VTPSPLLQLAVDDAPHGGGKDDDALRVRVGRPQAPDHGEAQIAVQIADPALAAAVTERIAAALVAATGALASAAPDAARVIALRSRKALARRVEDVAGALAIVPVTERNARHLLELVDAIRAAGALAVQLVWDGEAPPRERVEHHVFAVLERARATPLGPPVVLATDSRPAAALRFLVANNR